jgi:hypothetical protein
MRTASLGQINDMLSAGEVHDVESPIVPRTAPSGQGRPFDLQAFLSQHGIDHKPGEPYGDGTKFVLAECPFDSSHKAPDSFVMQGGSGVLIFKCSHNSCSHRKWQDFRQVFDSDYRDRQSQPPVNLSDFMATPSSAPAAGPGPAPSEPATFTRPRSVRQLVTEHTALRDPVIHGLLRRGETMNVIAPPKTGKSWLVNQLAIYGTTGGYWHGHMVERGNVLVLDNELHAETSADRIPRVAAAMEARAADYFDSVFVENLRGKSWDVFKSLSNKLNSG